MSDLAHGHSSELDRVRPLWLDHFANALKPAQFTPSALRGGDHPGAEIQEPREPEPVVEAEEPAIDVDALAQAFEEGRRSAELVLADEHAAVAKLAQALEALHPEPSAALAALLAETVDRLVRQIVGSVAVDGDLLAARARDAAALIGDELKPATLYVHPDDLPLLASASLPVGLAGAPELQRGTVKLECASGWIEDGPAVRLERLRIALDRMGSAE
jgi:flagellar assembly protein FliH